ncbi:hypothetical protein BH09PLA1_BH09PLA1_27540 [soil metagenome]
MPAELAALPVLVYETTPDSQAEARRLRWWILFGGVMYGLAGFGSNLTLLLMRFRNGRNPINTAWTAQDWQYFCANAVVCAAYATIAGSSWVAMRRAVTRQTLLTMLFICTITIGAIYLFVLVIHATRNAPLLRDWILYITRLLCSLVWPLSMLCVITAMDAVAPNATRRKLWIGVGVSAISLAIITLLSNYSFFLRTPSIYSTSLRDVANLAELAIFISMFTIATVAAVGGETRRLRIAATILLLVTISLELYSLFQLHQVLRRSLAEVNSVVIRELFSVSMIFMPMTITILSGRAVRNAASRG